MRQFMLGARLTTRFDKMAALRLASLAALLGGLMAFGWFAMVKMPGTSYQGPLPAPTDEVRTLEAELRQHVHVLAGDIGERNLFEYAKLVDAANYIRAALSAYGYEVRSDTYEVFNKVCENLEVEIPGGQKPDEIVVIGAHYDSVMGSPGANDNATGVAAMLALARAFSGTKPSRTVRFVAFVNEEPPFFQTRRMGSWVYAARRRQRGEQIVTMLSLETIGYYSDAVGSQSYPPPLGFVYPSSGNFIGFVSNLKNAELVRHVVATFRRQVQFPSEGGALLGFLPGVGWSDHWAFWKEGYPAVMVTDTALFRDPDYHLPSDTPEKVQYARMARVVSGLDQVIRALANP